MKEYIAIIEWTGANYSANVPDLPGCVAQGDTFEETQSSIKEAIEIHIEVLKEEGQPVPEPNVKTVSIAVQG